MSSSKMQMIEWQRGTHWSLLVTSKPKLVRRPTAMARLPWEICFEEENHAHL